MDVHLDIDELILDGFFSAGAPPDVRERLGQAVKGHLAQLFREQGVPAGLISGGAVPRLAGGSFNMLPGAAPELTGRQIALAIYRGLNT
jgi:hypothetical protein